MAPGKSMDLTRGSVFKKLVVFAFPILISNLLQQLYHAADVVVVGNFAKNSTVSLAAVGSTGSITTLLLNLFLGLSMGANVICANLFGARKKEELRRAMETALIVAAFSGLLVGAAGFFFARPLLGLMGSPDSVIDEATRYMQIIFLGQPASLVYNFGAGILRAHGDTKRPMYILSVAGIFNVVLNLVFVIVFHLDAAGVAIATIIAHYLSAIAVLILLFSPHGDFRLSLTRLRFDRKLFGKILRIGIPGGINGMVFSLSNVVIVSAVNSLGDVVVAGNSAAASVDSVVFQILSAIYSACISFAGQNFGAKSFKRIDRLLWQSILLTEGILAVICLFIGWNPAFFIGLFTKEAAVIRVGIPRLLTVVRGYLIYAVSEMCIGCLRGMGKSMVPTVLNLVSICVPRMIWTLLVFPHHANFAFLMLCYPISWVFSSVSQLICYLVCRRREEQKYLLACKAQDRAPAPTA